MMGIEEVIGTVVVTLLVSVPATAVALTYTGSVSPYGRRLLRALAFDPRHAAIHYPPR